MPPREVGSDWISVAMRARFPKLAMALGEAAFETMLASLYADVPDAQQSLVVADAQLPRFLASRASYPVWNAELAALDRANVEVLRASRTELMTRRALGLDVRLTLIPAHVVVELTTTADELWAALDDAAATGTRASARLPRSLDWPRTVLIWRREGNDVAQRTVEPDEAAALRAAARGTSIVELAASMGGANPHARALDVICRWLDDGVLAA